jgi:hypothetical protein
LYDDSCHTKRHRKTLWKKRKKRKGQCQNVSCI